MIKNLFLLLGSILILVISHLAYKFIQIKKTTSVNLINNSKCSNIKLDSSGPEDIIRYNDQYLITGTMNIHKLWHKSTVTDVSQLDNGKIYLIDINTNDVIELTLKDFPFDKVSFHPHGIDLANDLLYTINHAYAKGGERVEIFKINHQEKTATYIKSFVHKGDSLNGITNDLIVVNKEHDFITTQWNWMPHTNSGFSSLYKNLHILLTILNVKLTHVYYCKFSTNECFLINNTHAFMNNGITWNKKNTVYIADVLNKLIYEYNLDLNNIEDKHNILTYKRSIDLGVLTDNLEYDSSSNSISYNIIESVEEAGAMHDIINDDLECNGHSGAGVYDINSDSFNKVLMTKYCGGSSSIKVDIDGDKQSNKKTTKVFMGSFAADSIEVCELK